MPSRVSVWGILEAPTLSPLQSRAALSSVWVSERHRSPLTVAAVTVGTCCSVLSGMSLTPALQDMFPKHPWDPQVCLLQLCSQGRLGRWASPLPSSKSPPGGAGLLPSGTRSAPLLSTAGWAGSADVRSCISALSTILQAPSDVSGTP